MGYEHRSTDEQLRDVLHAVLDRRSRGEDLSDEQVIAGHPELMPGLAEELAALRRMDAALLGARRGGGGGNGQDAPVTLPLTDEELEQPIVLDGDSAADHSSRLGVGGSSAE